MVTETRDHLIERTRRDVAAAWSAGESAVEEPLAERRTAAAVEISEAAHVWPSRPG
ncbi:hypothetical protein [Actinopolyspora alba]|uniref:hypothetical protein n=1 Tax=Actinopolyspora alba TaxID=673379 RepID=UPI0015879D2D|nr:hypothetical protein [Actinopolyspora alba]